MKPILRYRATFRIRDTQVERQTGKKNLSPAKNLHDKSEAVKATHSIVNH